MSYPILYDAGEKSYLMMGKGLLLASKALVTTQRNGQYTVEITVPQAAVEEYGYADLVKVGMKITVKAGVRRGRQPFEINRITKSEKGDLVIYGVHETIAKLQQSGVALSFGTSKQDAAMALTIFNDNLVGDYRFDVGSDITTEKTCKWSVEGYENALELLGGKAGSILQNYKGEYEFDFDRIYLHKQYGRKAPTALAYGRNISTIEQDERIDATYTSIYPYATYQKEGAKEGKSEIVGIPEKIIDSKYVGNYKNGRRIKTVNFSESFGEKNKPTPEKLKKLAMKYVESNNLGVPKTRLELSYIDLSKMAEYREYQFIDEVDICDIVPVYYAPLRITDERAKVVEVVYDALLEENHSIVLGTIGQTISSKLSQSLAEQLDELGARQDKIDEMVPYLVNAKGNRVWRVKPDPNMKHKVGDVWFEKNGKYSRIRVWDGTDWVIEVDTEQLGRMLEAVKKQAEHMDETIKKQSKQFEAERDRLNKSIDSLSTKIDENIDDLRGRTDGILRITGADGHLVYGNNRLLGETDRTLTPYEDKTVIKHNGDGFVAGKKYTLHFCVQVDKRPVQVWGSGGSYRVTQESIYKEGD